MIYGEHLSADEQEIKCACGVTATVEVKGKQGCLCGWFCRRCAARKRDELKHEETLAKAVVRRGTR